MHVLHTSTRFLHEETSSSSRIPWLLGYCLVTTREAALERTAAASLHQLLNTLALRHRRGTQSVWEKKLFWRAVRLGVQQLSCIAVSGPRMFFRWLEFRWSWICQASGNIYRITSYAMSLHSKPIIHLSIKEHQAHLQYNRGDGLYNLLQHIRFCELHWTTSLG